MSLDLFERDTGNRMDRLVPVDRPEPSAWDGFARGTGMVAMGIAASGARSIHRAGAVVPIAYDAMTNGVEAQTRYFSSNVAQLVEDAVDFWTPNPGEVGWAGQVAGTLLGILPLVIASPSGAVATTQLSMSEDLMKKGVDPVKAQAVGAVYGAGLGLGIWVPILGRTLPQRMLLGGAGFNVTQGVAMRGAASAILEGTPAEGSFHAFAPEDLTLDVLLGLAFGGIAHLSPAMRAQGEEFWQRIEAWRANLTPDQLAGLSALRAAQHATADSLPGHPASPEAVDAHVARVRAAIGQVATGERVNVGHLPPADVTPNLARAEESLKNTKQLQMDAERIRIEEGLPHPPDMAIEYGNVPRETLPEVRGFERPTGAAILPEVPRPVYEGVAPEQPAAGVRPVQAAPRRTFDLTHIPAEEQPRAIGRAVEDALTAIRVEPEEARANATLWESFFRTTADRHAVPAAKILESYGVDIRRLGELEDLPGALAQKPLPEGITSDRRLNAIQRLEEAKTRAEAARTEAKQAQVDLAALRTEGAPAEVIEAATQRWKTARETVGRHDLDAKQLREQLERERVGEKRVLFQPLLKALGQRRFYSELGRQIDEVKQESASPEQWKGMLKNMRGVKRDEIQWTGIEEWLDLQTGKVTKQQIQEFLAGNAVKVEEVVLGKHGTLTQERTTADDWIADDMNLIREHGLDITQQGEFWGIEDPQRPHFDRDVLMEELRNANPRVASAVERVVTHLMEGPEVQGGGTKFATYQLPGGENYRELLITLPEQAPAGPRRNLEVRPAPGGDGFAIWEGDQQISPGAMSRNDATLLMGQWQMTTIAEGGPRFTTGHWDEPNVLAHVRFNERTDAEGKRVLFVEEIQSDWAQKGKREGFVPEPKEIELEAEKWVPGKPWQSISAKHLMNAGAPNDFVNRWMQHISDAHKEMGRIPRAPFVGKTEAWVGLTLKRMIAWAVENGFDRVAWTTGEQQVSRYTGALRKAVDEIQWKKTEQGVQLVGYKGKGGQILIEEALRETGATITKAPPSAPSQWALTWRDGSKNYFHTRDSAEEAVINDVRKTRGWDIRQEKVVDTTQKEDTLSDAIGKAMAKRILEDPAESGTITGENIRIDDPGMAAFYDRMVPNIANDILKKLGGGKVGTTSIKTAAEVEPTSLRAQSREPDFEPMTRESDRGAFAGAEDFADGKPPLMADIRVYVNDRSTDAMMLIAPGGVHVYAGEGELRWNIDVPQIANATQESALNWVLRNWTRPGFWSAMELIEGKVPGETKTMEQPAFDITPEMRERVPKGMPLFQQGRGQIQFSNKQTVIGLFENADRSTFLHETGHFFLEVTRDLANRPTAPADVLKDWGILAKWLKIEGGPIEVEAHEKFARGFERYLAEGKAPNEGLKSVFEQFKQWLLAIYHSITDIDVNLTDDVRAVMDRMLAPSKPEGPAGQTRPAVTPPPRRAREQPAGPAGQSRLMRDIRKLGGLDQSNFEDITGEKRFGKVKGLPWGVFRKGGVGVDDMATQLRDLGWPIPDDAVDGGVQALKDLISQELVGQKTVKMGEEGEVMSSASMLREMDELAAQYNQAETEAAEKFGFRSNDPQFQAEITRLRQQRDAQMAEMMQAADDPLKAEAVRVAHQKPNLKIRIGEDIEGNARNETLRQYLEDASLAAERAAEDAKLFDVAAACLRGSA